MAKAWYELLNPVELYRQVANTLGQLYDTFVNIDAMVAVNRRQEAGFSRAFQAADQYGRPGTKAFDDYLSKVTAIRAELDRSAKYLADCITLRQQIYDTLSKATGGLVRFQTPQDILALRDQIQFSSPSALSDLGIAPLAIIGIIAAVAAALWGGAALVSKLGTSYALAMGSQQAVDKYLANVGEGGGVVGNLANIFGNAGDLVKWVVIGGVAFLALDFIMKWGTLDKLMGKPPRPAPGPSTEPKPQA